MLSDNQKRLICRLGFVLLCALPTLFCAKAILFPATPQEWSHRILEQTGIHGEVQQVQRWSPDQTGLSMIQVGGRRFDSRFLLEQSTLTQTETGNRLSIGLGRGSVTAFWQMLDAALEHESSLVSVTELQFQSLTFLQDDQPAAQSMEWQEVSVKINREKSQLVIRSRLPSRTDRFVPGESTLQIEKQLVADATSWSIAASGFQLPAWILDPILPIFGSVNPDSLVADCEVSMVQKSETWSGIASAKLSQVDLDHLIGRRFGTMLSGQAQLNIESLNVVDNRIASVRGDVYSQHGVIGSRLLQAATHTMGLQLVEPYGQGMQEGYTDLRFGFRLVEDQIAIVGMKSGALMNDPEGHLMMIVPQGKSQAVSGLLDLVAWPAERMPWSAASLARHLIVSPIHRDSAGSSERTAQSEPVGATFFNRQPVNR